MNKNIIPVYIRKFISFVLVLLIVFLCVPQTANAAVMDNSNISFDLKKNTNIKFKTYVRGLGYKNLTAKITKYKRRKGTASGTSEGGGSKSTSYQSGSDTYSRTWDTKGGTADTTTTTGGTTSTYDTVEFEKDYYVYNIVIQVIVPNSLVKKIKKKVTTGPAFCFNAFAVDYKTGENLMFDNYTLSDNYQLVNGTTMTQRWTTYNPITSSSGDILCYRRYYCEMKIYCPKTYKRLCVGVAGSRKPSADGSYETATVGTENVATVLFDGIHKGKNASFWDGYADFTDTTYYSKKKKLSHFIRLK